MIERFHFSSLRELTTEQTAEAGEQLEVFQPNSHSVETVEWRSADPEKILEVNQVLRLHFGYHEIVEVKQSNQLEARSNNFLVTVRQRGVNKHFVLKKNIAIQDEASLALIEDVVDHVQQSGLPTARQIPSETGARHVSYNGHLWQLFSHIQGTHYGGTEKQLIAAARATGNIHSALETFPHGDKVRNKPQLTTPWTDEGLSEIFQKAEQSNLETDVLLTRYREFIEGQASIVQQNAPLVSKAKKQLGKGLIHPHDFFFNGDQLAGVIDFEEVGEFEVAREIGGALHRLVRRYVERQNKPWRETLGTGVSLFLDSYRSVHQLSDEDIALVPILLRDDLLRKIQIASAKYVGDEGKRLSEVKKFITLLKEADYIAQAIRGYLHKQ